MTTTNSTPISHRRWSLVLFLAVLVGIAQFGLGQFSPWVIAAPFVALLVMDAEGIRRGDKEPGRRGEGVLAQAAATFVFHGIMIGAVMTAVGDSAQHSSGRFVMAKSAGAGCGSGGVCGGGQAAAGTLASSATMKSGCGSGGCGSAAGGCGSGGCGAGGGTVASSATGKSACGCGGGGANAGDAKAMMVQIPSDAAKMQNANQMRPGLPPIMARPNGTAGGVTNERVQAGSLHHLGMPGVTNQPIAVSPEARSVILVQPKTGAPQPPQGTSAKLPVPTNVTKGGNRSLPGSPATVAPPSIISEPPPKLPEPDLATAIERAAALPKERKTESRPSGQ